MFSHRTNWHRQHNRLTELLEARRASGKMIFDLTVSNPTECGFTYPDAEILKALTNPDVLKYRPEPGGLRSAREAIAGYYAAKDLQVDPDNIFLTSSTSEAYSLIFKLLCDPGDSVLVPVPSYPLFEYLAQVNDVALSEYHLRYDHGWYLDVDSLSANITPQTRAIILVHPHNPTGMFVKKDELQKVITIAREHHLALVVDEVFIDYAYAEDADRTCSTAAEQSVLTFTLNGISKMIGMPQMKLGWISISGPDGEANEARERLEILCDTYLSVNTPVQVALPELLRLGSDVQRQIRDRITSNRETFTHLLNPRTSNLKPACSSLEAEGGWSAILRLPRTKSDEEWAVELLEKTGVYVYPGHYFDFEGEALIVVSLLAEVGDFRGACEKLIDFVAKQ